MARGERLAAALVTVLAAAACSGSDGGGPAADAAPATTAGASTTTAVTACDPARPAPSGRERRTTVHDGIEREYTLSIPASYDGATPAPLLLNLHGFGGTADAQDERTGLPEAGGARGYVVVTPQGLPISIPSGIPGAGDAARFEGIPFWNFFGSGEVDFGGAVLPGGVDPSELGADDVGFLSGLLDELEEELCVDPDRFYSTGMSNGAGMTTTLGCELGERLAAIAPVSGVNLTGRCPGDAPVSVLAVHGDADPAVVYEGGSLMGFRLGNPSVPGRMAAWAERDGCDPESETDVPLPGVVVTRWVGCEDGTEVELWTIAGWEHEWPRASSPGEPGVIDATELVLDFFDDHRRVGPAGPAGL